MTQANGTNGTTNTAAKLTLSVALVAAMRSQAMSDAKHFTEEGAVKTWDAVVKYVFADGQPAATDTAAIALVKARNTECSTVYVEAYVTSQGVKAVAAKDVKAGKGSQKEADAYDRAKRAGRACYGMGTNRAMERAGYSRPKQNTGGGSGDTETKETAKTESTTILPPSFSRDMDVVRDMIAAFQVQHGARLNRAGKDAIGEIAAAHGKCIEALLPKGTNGVTPPTAPALGAALEKAAEASTTH